MEETYTSGQFKKFMKPTELSPATDVASFAQQWCTEVTLGADGPTVYMPKTTKTSVNGCLRQVEIGVRTGSEQEARRNTKHVMLMGATGVGKSTLINAMFNHILGVKFADPVRFKLFREENEADQTKSVTKCVTAYTIHHQPWFALPYTIVIVDTPGFGDTGGLLEDEHVKNSIKNFFKEQGKNGIKFFNTIGFVMKANDQKLTVTQRYIFDCVFTLFGKDMAKVVDLFATHSDPESEKEPACMAGVRQENVPCNKVYKFNFDEARLYDTKEKSFKKLCWDMGSENFQSFFGELAHTEGVLLEQTLNVLREREELEDALGNIEKSMGLGLNEMERLRKEREALEQCKHDIDANQNFEYEALEQYVEEKPLSDGKIAINCKTCQVTCLTTKYPWKNHSFEKCFLFRRVGAQKEDGFCSRCPNGCEPSNHEVCHTEFVFKTRRLMKTVQYLQKNYEEAEGKKLTAEQIIKECEERIVDVKKETYVFVQKARQCHNTLKNIALKPEPISMEAYIDLMIKAEERSGEADSGRRIQTLKSMKTTSELMKDIIPRPEEKKQNQAATAQSDTTPEERPECSDSDTTGDARSLQAADYSVRIPRFFRKLTKVFRNIVSKSKKPGKEPDKKPDVPAAEKLHGVQVLHETFEKKTPQYLYTTEISAQVLAAVQNAELSSGPEKSHRGVKVLPEIPVKFSKPDSRRHEANETEAKSSKPEPSPASLLKPEVNMATLPKAEVNMAVRQQQKPPKNPKPNCKLNGASASGENVKCVSEVKGLLPKRTLLPEPDGSSDENSNPRPQPELRPTPKPRPRVNRQSGVRDLREAFENRISSNLEPSSSTTCGGPKPPKKPARVKVLPSTFEAWVSRVGSIRGDEDVQIELGGGDEEEETDNISSASSSDDRSSADDVDS